MSLSWINISNWVILCYGIENFHFNLITMRQITIEDKSQKDMKIDRIKLSMKIKEKSHPYDYCYIIACRAVISNIWYWYIRRASMYTYSSQQRRHEWLITCKSCFSCVNYSLGLISLFNNETPLVQWIIYILGKYFKISQIKISKWMWI